MTPEALKRGNEIFRERDKLKDRLKNMQAQKDVMKGNNLQPRISFGHGGASTPILEGAPDSDMIFMVCMMAEARIESRLKELEAEFEALC